jgi:hypothetical protein
MTQHGGLKFEGTINLGQVMIALSFVVSAIVAFYAVRIDVEVLKIHVATLTAADKAAETRAEQFRTEVVGELRAVNLKLEAIRSRLDRFESTKK